MHVPRTSAVYSLCILVFYKSASICCFLASLQEYIFIFLLVFCHTTGVHSAIQHDSIMQSGEPDYALVEGEAQRVAQEAARALKASRAACYNATSGKPTWTGTSGVRCV